MGYFSNTNNNLFCLPLGSTSYYFVPLSKSGPRGTRAGHRGTRAGHRGRDILPYPRTRGDIKVRFPIRRAILQTFKKGSHARGVKLWNRLKPEVQKAPTVAAFKRLYKTTPLDPPRPTS